MPEGEQRQNCMVGQRQFSKELSDKSGDTKRQSLIVFHLHQTYIN